MIVVMQRLGDVMRGIDGDMERKLFSGAALEILSGCVRVMDILTPLDGVIRKKIRRAQRSV